MTRRRWWRELDLNQRRRSQRIYSPSPLTTRASLRSSRQGHASKMDNPFCRVSRSGPAICKPRSAVGVMTAQWGRVNKLSHKNNRFGHAFVQWPQRGRGKARRGRHNRLDARAGPGAHQASCCTREQSAYKRAMSKDDDAGADRFKPRHPLRQASPRPPRRQARSAGTAAGPARARNATCLRERARCIRTRSPRTRSISTACTPCAQRSTTLSAASP